MSLCPRYTRWVQDWHSHKDPLFPHQCKASKTTNSGCCAAPPSKTSQPHPAKASLKRLQVTSGQILNIISRSTSTDSFAYISMGVKTTLVMSHKRPGAGELRHSCGKEAPPPSPQAPKVARTRFNKVRGHWVRGPKDPRRSPGGTCRTPGPSASSTAPSSSHVAASLRCSTRPRRARNLPPDF